MPKTVAAEKKIFKCDFCDKTYAHASGKSAHEKSKHFIEKKEARAKKLMNVADKPTVNVELQMIKIKQDFVDGKIDLVEYQRLADKLELVKKTQNKKASSNQLQLDLGRVIRMYEEEYSEERHREVYNIYVQNSRYLYQYLTQFDIKILANHIMQKDYLKLFIAVYAGQIYIFTDDIDSYWIQYLDGDELVEHELTLELLKIMINNVINTIYYHSTEEFDEQADHEQDLTLEDALKLLSNCISDDGIPFYQMVVQFGLQHFTNKPLDAPSSSNSDSSSVSSN